MIKLSYDEAVAKIKEHSTLTSDEIKSRIDAKLNQFSGLVSKEGAAHILANELGIKLIQPAQQPAKLKVANILEGMQNVEVLAKIINIYPAKQFNTNGRSGQVGSVFMGDETGTIRTVFWNDQANKLSLLNKGDVVSVMGAYVRMNRNNQLELHLNDRSSILVNPPGEIVEVKEFRRETPRKKINEIADTDNFVEVFGTVVEVFDIRFFEDKRAMANQPDGSPVIYSYVMSVFLDDGTAAVRTVFFRDQLQKLLKLSNDELMAFRENPEAFEAVKNNALGNFLRITARVNKNEMFNRIELIVNEVEETNPEEARIAAAATGKQQTITPQEPLEMPKAESETPAESMQPSEEKIQ